MQKICKCILQRHRQLPIQAVVNPDWHQGNASQSVSRPPALDPLYNLPFYDSMYVYVTRANLAVPIFPYPDLFFFQKQTGPCGPIFLESFGPGPKLPPNQNFRDRSHSLEELLYGTLKQLLLNIHTWRDCYLSFTIHFEWGISIIRAIHWKR